jgi:hypothetical protein
MAESQRPNLNVSKVGRSAEQATERKVRDELGNQSARLGRLLEMFPDSIEDETRQFDLNIIPGSIIEATSSIRFPAVGGTRSICFLHVLHPRAQDMFRSSVGVRSPNYLIISSLLTRMEREELIAVSRLVDEGLLEQESYKRLIEGSHGAAGTYYFDTDGNSAKVVKGSPPPEGAEIVGIETDDLLNTTYKVPMSGRDLVVVRYALDTLTERANAAWEKVASENMR